MTFRSFSASVIAIVVAVGCARLGVWQLERHEQRRQYNAAVAEQRDAAPIELALHSADSVARYRRAYARGVFDFAHEFVLANRTRNGAPGVHLITPLLLAGGRAILVDRGWVYSPDATSVDRELWRDADSVDVSGYVEALQETAADRRSQLAPGVWQRLDRDALNSAMPYRVGATYLVAAEVTPAAEHAPARVGLPPLEQGPHLSYAFQWFAFGTIALVGGGVLVVQDRRRRR